MVDSEISTACTSWITGGLRYRIESPGSNGRRMANSTFSAGPRRTHALSHVSFDTTIGPAGPANSSVMQNRLRCTSRRIRSRRPRARFTAEVSYCTQIDMAGSFAWEPGGIGDRFEYRDVRVDGDDGPIVAGFSARIPADGLTALAGPSGSGKTTLLRLLNRLDDPDGGAVLFDGRDVRDYDVLELRRRVQLVGQVPVPFAGTVFDNVGPQWDELAARVGLPPSLGARQADLLSVGEAQRMCLARALARHPDCLVLDEPTSALDTASKSGVEALIRSLADDGLTVVMVTHDPRQAGELADRVIRIGAAPT